MSEQRLRRGLVIALMLAWLGCPAPLRAADPTPQKETPKEERARLEKQAEQLNQQVVALYGKGRYPEAVPVLKEVLALYQQLYPAQRYPAGHPLLASSLNNMGFLLQAQGEYGQALGYFRQALAMWQRLYPADKYPDGHPDVAISLNNLGYLLQEQREYGEARGYLKQALEMRRRLYPPDKYPDGHPDLALSLNNLGILLQARGEYGQALGYLKQALEMRRHLYPPDKYPAGHPDLATSLNNLGTLLHAQREYGQALGYFRQALEMDERLFPADKYPAGHPELANSLHNLGTVLQEQGEYGQALRSFKRLLEMRQRMYPTTLCPAGHPLLAQSLNDVGSLLNEQGEYGQALGYLRRALEMYQRLYPADKYPAGHHDLADSLNNLGVLLQERGEYGQALRYYRQTLEMRRRLYPPDKYPDGHADVATSLNNLGLLLDKQGEYGQALGYYKQALEMRRRLYPPDKYPDGHSSLAESLHNLGALRQEQGEYGQARRYYRQALEISERLYPPDKYPAGHYDLAMSLGNLGYLLQEQGEYGQAVEYCKRALAMWQRLYPADRFPAGRPDVAISLNNLGTVLHAQGDYGEALEYHKRALEMYQRLYPLDQYPNGHPHLASSLHNLGAVLQAQEKFGQALGCYRQALAMHGRLAGAFADAASEAEALNYLASLPGSTRGALLTCAAALPSSSPDEVYAALWQHKAAASAVLQRRQLLLHAAGDEPTRRLVGQLLDARRQLARLLLAPAVASVEVREGRLARLTARKEDLERRLAQQLPDVARRQALERASLTDLLDRLPDRTAFLDLVRYYGYDAKRIRLEEARYVVFVLQRGQPVRQAELGPAAPIEQALARWRQDIENKRTGSAAVELRRLVWEPIAKHLQPGTETVYLSPEGALAALPWAALPGDKPGTVLLEEYALALVPNGPALLEQLTPTEKAAAPRGSALVLGGVQYDERPPADAGSRGEYRRSADLGGRAVKWDSLPGTAAERQQVAALARCLTGAAVVELGGREAGTQRLLQELPRARWAHLATHGFFAASQNDDERRALLHDRDFAFGVRAERRGAGARNPLVQTGLVLAGANLPPQGDPLDDDRGLVTAEAVAGLDLRGLSLAVLSACNTGRGEEVGPEGIFGLQRAFHLGGCRDVVASLWRVDDEPTAALMALFYRNLWGRKMPPLQALREAQLTLRRHPEAVPLLARERGPNFDKVVKEVEAASSAAPPAPQEGGTAPVRYWAAFVLSGIGR